MSKLGRGIILQQLLLRVVSHSRLLGIDRTFLTVLGESAITLMEDMHPRLREWLAAVPAELEREEARLLETLERA